MIARSLVMAAVVVSLSPGLAAAAPKPKGGKPRPPPRWKVAPLPPAMPAPDAVGDLAIDDFELHYQVFGKGDAVVLLHGGFGWGDNYAGQVPALAASYHVIVVDSRGHGRSTRSAHGLSYHLMAEDVIALLDHLQIDRAAIVGWSDGGVIGLDLAVHHADRLTRVFVIGTNYTLAGMKSPGNASTISSYFGYAEQQYAKLAPDPTQKDALLEDLQKMWSTQPTYTDEQMRGITVPVMVALGDHDELIRRAHVEKLAKLIPHGQLAILKDVSHFALWQDPDQFDRVLLDFLAAH